ncbi:CRP-like cAMP-binding protein [Acinetobacter calcoaceticus]|uniref:CRP-like cAMP-binding protein n=1 Tax=Acinetobacter calcoaceticus TaxID=471 RepID=A0A4R1XG47_ACICA|nr:CRP-like cAMP-binding protein [Acinetobacter calcoaceticus]
MQQIRELLDHYPFIQHLDQSEKESLIEQIKVKKFYHNQMIYSQNTSINEVMLVLNGIIKTSWVTIEGKNFTKMFVPAGLLINIVPLIAERPLIHDYIAYGNTTVAIIPGAIFLNIIQANPQALFYILKLVCIRSQFSREQLHYAATDTLRIRLAKELLFLAHYHASKLDNVIHLKLKLTHENFAELLQSSRQSINREFSWLAQAGIVQARYNQIAITDLTRLTLLAKSNTQVTDTLFA